MEPGLYHLATRQGRRVCISGISAELELGDAAMETADLEAQTNAVLCTVEQALREGFECGLGELSEATVYMVFNSDWLVDEGIVRQPCGEVEPDLPEHGRAGGYRGALQADSGRVGERCRRRTAVKIMLSFVVRLILYWQGNYK